MKRTIQIFSLLFVTALILMMSKLQTISAIQPNASFYNSNYLYGTYVKKVNGNRMRYETARFLRRSDGQFAYCLQPFLEFIDGKIQIAHDSDYATINQISQKQWERISLLAYYGYQYGTHIEDKWYIITQMMIWRTIDPYSDFYFTDTLNGNRVLRYQEEMSELNYLVNHHEQYPIFSGKKYTISIGELLILKDTNNALLNYEVTKVDNITATVVENQLEVISSNVGTYQIQLTKKDKKYSVPPIVYVGEGQNLMTVGYYDPMSITVNIHVVGGKIQIQKVDDELGVSKPQGDATLTGAIYHVMNEQNEIVASLEIGNDGTATTDFLPLGTYQIQEVSSSTGYNLDPNIYSVTIDSKDTKTIVVKEPVIKGKIELTKVDSKTKQCKPQGEAELIGARYGVYDKFQTLVDTIVIGDNCRGISKELPYGNYTIQELESSFGYQLNSKIDSVFIEEEKNYSLTVEEDVIENQLEIYKYYEDIFTGIMHTEANATFEIYNYKEELIHVIETDEKGYVSITLPYGKYSIRHTLGLDGYKLIDPFSIVIDENTPFNQVKYLKDEMIQARMKLVKIDAETKKPILGSHAKFKIKDLINKKDICQTTNQVICEFETDDNGILVTPLPLPIGKYQLEEIQAPNDYLLSTQPIIFTITNDDSLIEDPTYGTIVEIVFENTPIKGQIEIYKIGEQIIIENGKFDYQKVPQGNVIFGLYNLDNNLIQTVETDSTGYATINHLKLGTYYLRELKSSNGNLVDEQVYTFDIVSKDQITPVVTKTFQFTNYLPKGSLEFVKVDNLTKEPLADTKIQIYTEQGNLLFEGITDYIGKIYVPNLPLGTYYILEKEAKDGYQLNENKLYFEILKNEEIVTVTMENKREPFVKSETKEIIVPDTEIIEIDFYHEIGCILLFIGVILGIKHFKND